MRVTDEMVDAFHRAYMPASPIGDADVRAGLEAALATMPQVEGLETTAEERAAVEAACADVLAQVDRGDDVPISPADMLRFVRDIDRLAARLAAAEAEKREVRKILVRAHDRIHALPRTSDTDLATAIEHLLGRLSHGEIK